MDEKGLGERRRYSSLFLLSILLALSFATWRFLWENARGSREQDPADAREEAAVRGNSREWFSTVFNRQNSDTALLESLLVIDGLYPGELGLAVAVASDPDLDGGRAYVLDLNTPPSYLKVFHPDGTFVQSFGRLGEEIDSEPVDLTVDEGSVWVLDSIANLYQFSGEGHLIKKVTLSTDRRLNWVRSLAAGPGETLYVLGIPALYQIDTGGRVIKEIGIGGSDEENLGNEGSEFYIGPTSVVSTPDGDLLVADPVKGRVVRYNSLGAYQGSFASGYQSLEDLAIDGQGRLLAANPSEEILEIRGPDGLILRRIAWSSYCQPFLPEQYAGPVSVAWSGPEKVWVVDGCGAGLQLLDLEEGRARPVGVTYRNESFIFPKQVEPGPAGGILILAGNPEAESKVNNRVLLFNRNGGLVRRYESSFNQGSFLFPQAVAQGDSESTYILDVALMQVFDSRGRLTKTFGQGGTGSGQWGTEIRMGLEFGPSAMESVSGGNLLVADTFNERLQEFSSKGALVREIPLPAGTRPTAVTQDGDGSILVLDGYTGLVLGLRFSGQVDWSFKGSFGLPPGPSSEQDLELSGGMAVDRDGRIWLSDSYNHRLLVFNRDGELQESYGAPGSQPGYFLFPAGLAFDRQGNLLVADRMNQRIQVFKTPGG
ncbi:MAG: hypothetical protein HYY09_02265 [Firmicutes bacterium]|nr:hypothetical protein [Bacillota bacterium]